jgi:hypothetical protein
MGPFANRARRVGPALVLGRDGLDLLHDFDRPAEPQDMTTACARDFPSLKAITPRIVIERSVIDGLGHSTLDMHVPVALLILDYPDPVCVL